jgi:hypothetical protein
MPVLDSPPLAKRLRPARSRGYARDVGVVLVSLMSLKCLMSAIPVAQHTLGSISPPDFVTDYRVAAAFHDGYNPYSAAGARRSNLNRWGDTGFGHPPTTGFWAIPLTRFDLLTANAVLGWISLLALLMELVTLTLTFRCPGPLVVAFGAFSYLVDCPFMQYHLSAGQWSEAIGFMCFGSWFHLRRGRDELAGACLGAACSLKLFPGLLVLFLIVARRFRAAACAVGVYLTIAIVMTTRFGFESWRVFWGAQRRIADRFVENIQNQSIHGIVARLFFPACESPAGHVVGAAAALSSFLSLAILAAVIWAVRSPERLGRAFDLAFATFVVLSLFSSQWTWEHYNVILVLPMAILLGHVGRLWRGGHRAWGALTVGIVAGTLASWSLSIREKTELQLAVQQGNHRQHARLHALEALNWLPAFLMLALLVRLLYLQTSDREHRQDPKA